MQNNIDFHNTGAILLKVKGNLKMKQLVLTIKRLLIYFPTTLPIGVAEFETWADDIYSLLGKGFENVPKRDIRYVLATMIMHLKSESDAKAKVYFIRGLRKSAANQVAGQIFTNIKEEQQAEATANTNKAALQDEKTTQ